VSLRVDLNLIAPRLRRYARALVCACPGLNEAADALVGAALRQVYADGAALPSPDLEIEAYAALVLLNREHVRAAELGGAPSHGANGASALVKAGGSRNGGGRPPETLTHFPVSNDTLSSALFALKLEEREALLLVGLEGFAYARAARILKISRSILIARLGRARERLPTNLQAEPALRRARPRPPHLRLVK
jgi:RNA polymerase sigma-70 factor (ECF subfamily)